MADTVQEPTDSFVNDVDTLQKRALKRQLHYVGWRTICFRYVIVQ